jgi:DNA-binding FrmR family transcriptional regulator
MVEQDRYCVDIVMQVSAARAALAKVAKVLIRSHLETCVSDALAVGGRERREKIDELIRLFETDV